MNLQLVDKNFWQVNIGFAIVESINIWDGVVLGDKWQCYYLNDKILGHEFYNKQINYRL